MGNPFQKTLPDGRNVLRGDVWFTMNSIINSVIYLLLFFSSNPWENHAHPNARGAVPTLRLLAKSIQKMVGNPHLPSPLLLTGSEHPRCSLIFQSGVPENPSWPPGPNTTNNSALEPVLEPTLRYMEMENPHQPLNRQGLSLAIWRRSNTQIIPV